MVDINTLGPFGTDSESAAITWLREQNIEGRIVLWSNFKDMLENKAQLKGDFIVFPAGYIDPIDKMTWVDFHFENLYSLELIDSFSLYTKPMVLLENHYPVIDAIALQPATESILKNFQEVVDPDIDILYFDSKPLAYKAFAEKGIRYCICSTPNQMCIGADVLRSFQPSMVWCVYEVQ